MPAVRGESSVSAAWGKVEWLDRGRKTWLRWRGTGGHFVTTKYLVLATDGQFTDGKATDKDELVQLSNGGGEAPMTIHLVPPNNATGPVPAVTKWSPAQWTSCGTEASSAWGHCSWSVGPTHAGNYVCRGDI
jgi:hypothetical protein